MHISIYCQFQRVFLPNLMAEFSLQKLIFLKFFSNGKLKRSLISSLLLTLSRVCSDLTVLTLEPNQPSHIPAKNRCHADWIDRVAAYIHGIIVVAASQYELLKCLFFAFSQIQQYGFCVEVEKCESF